MRICSTVIAYPNAKVPHQGVFIRERLRRLAALDDVEVISPILTFPGLRYIRHDVPCGLPCVEQQGAIRVHHPPMYYLPGLAKCADGTLLYLAASPIFARLHRERPFDIIDAHFAYPEAVGAALLARRFRVPFSVTLRGVIEHILDKPLRLRQALWALNRADVVITVSGQLADLAKKLGISPGKIHVVPNGVDASEFFPLNRAEARKTLGLDPEAPMVVSVGHLVERKGFHRLVEVMPELRRRFPDLQLLIVGGAMLAEPYELKLRKMIADMGLSECVKITGPQLHERINLWINAGNVFALATRYEGWCNVLMEALAAGLPVVTTNVGGNREIISSPDLGRVVELGDREALLRALGEALTLAWDRDRIVNYARQYTWEAAAERTHALFSDVLARRARAQG